MQRICRLARARGIFTIVDGAHAGAQFPFAIRDLECDSYAVSLHKWLLAPFGTGILYVRKDLIASVWPLQAAPAQSDTQHPQVRGDRHVADGAESGDRRRARVSSRHRRRAQGRAALLPDDALGDAAAIDPAHPDVLEPEARRDLGHGDGRHPGHARPAKIALRSSNGTASSSPRWRRGRCPASSSRTRASA